MAEAGVYGVLANNPKLRGMVNYHPKTAAFFLESDKLFERRRQGEVDPSAYAFRMVYSTAPNRDLNGSIFVEYPWR